MKRKKLLWTILLVPILISVPMATAATSSTSMVYVDPSLIWNPTMGIGTQFSIDIVVDYVENLWGYQFWLSFDPTILQGVSVENGPFLGSAGGPVLVAEGEGFVYIEEPEDDPHYAELKLFGASIFFFGEPPCDEVLPDGGGVLATVTFEVVGIGCSPIILGTDTGLGGIDRQEPCGPGDFYWIYYGPGKSGAFANTEEGPQLYISGFIWPQRFISKPDVTQTLYSTIYNMGEEGAWVKVKFTVTSSSYGTQTYWSNEAWIDAKSGWFPEYVTLSTDPFMPPGPGLYFTSACLYFKTLCMENYEPYEIVVEGTGKGRACTRDKGGFFIVYEPPPPPPPDWDD